ncbi:MAG: bifunctional diaminohydroxyphosphoribosylaminopyrimidine deaminase/5-amino-6-(5-phosphoribosylamino)uracil reductase RibD [Cyanobacteria bacterium HKST-UBA02]|nr:bifunctional diaminohydroxyphosphoribosylaminopyrimidine deaminase/5-amino-6-(5-phosphoribosylamino)uracil reductase RibD [Cyanobacteria bacterium HKST-UBA02]
MFDSRDEELMRQCLELAEKGRGRTSPNPMVGALVMDARGEIVGRGFHEKAGEPHAEPNALAEAGTSARGGTLYVSLEPCCHHGKTPPCSDAVIAAGIKKVVAAMEDPNPKVAGQGLSALRDRGIDVQVGLLAREAAWLNRGFLTALKKNRPWLTLKMAVTLDGRIADRSGKSRWITGPEARAWVHHQRNETDAVMIGAGTARADDPSLNVRDLESSRDSKRDPVRVILDSRLTIPPQAKVLDPGAGGPTLIYCLENAMRETDYSSGVTVVEAPGAAGRLDLEAVLQDLSFRGIRSVLCEGGAGLAGALIEADLADELAFITAPLLLPDSQAVPVTSSSRATMLDEARRFRFFDCIRLGDDVLLRARKIEPEELLSESL